MWVVSIIIYRCCKLFHICAYTKSKYVLPIAKFYNSVKEVRLGFELVIYLYIYSIIHRSIV